MNKLYFYSYIIVVVTILFFIPWKAVSQSFQSPTIGSISNMQSEEFQRKANEIQQQLQNEINRYFNKFKFIPIILFLSALTMTYCWSVLNKKIESFIIFVSGFTVGGPFISFWFLKMNPNIDEVKTFFIGGIFCGIISYIFYWIGWILKKIAIFLGGAILPIVFLFYFGFLNHFNQLNNTELIAYIIISVISGFIWLHLEKYQIFNVALSAISGAILIGFLIFWTNGLGIFDILKESSEIDIYNFIKHEKNLNHILFIIGLAISGMIVQTGLLSIKKRNKSKSKSKIKERVSVQSRDQ